MTSVEEWLKKEKGRELTGDEKRTLDELVEDATFSLYCQSGGGQCMSEFGKKVAVYASVLGVEPDILFRKLIDGAVEVLKKGDFDF
ncbi:MAG: hypothetical protein ACXQT5_00965 [Candidatus Syntropharchaeia archaeon]